MPYSEAQKRATYRWMSANVEKIREIRNRATATYYLNNSVELNKKSMEKYYLKKEMKTFLKILL